MVADDFVVLIEWQDDPVLDGTEMVVRATSEIQAIREALQKWEREDAVLYPTCRVVNIRILASRGATVDEGPLIS